MEKFEDGQLECNIQYDPANLNYISEWIPRLRVQTQRHKSPNSDSSLFGDPLVRVGQRSLRPGVEDESLVAVRKTKLW